MPSQQTPSQARRQLLSLYRAQLFGKAPWWQSEDYSCPLLVCPSDAYFASKRRTVVVGQQTHGWGIRDDRWDTPEELMELYENFVAAGGNRRTPFWQVLRRLADELAEGLESIAWTNLYRFDERKNPPAHPKAWYLSKSVLVEELKLLDPDYVLFVTGPSYAWEVLDVSELGMNWKYAPKKPGTNILGTIQSNGSLLGLHTLHPGARKKGHREALCRAISKAAP